MANVNVGSSQLPVLTFSTRIVTAQSFLDGGGALVWKISVTVPRTTIVFEGAADTPVGIINPAASTDDTVTDDMGLDEYILLP